MTEGVRINKYLSEAGFCSRREADRLIAEGKVLIDGKLPEIGTRVMPGQSVTVDGKKLHIADKKVVIAYNKPIGIECTSDSENKDNIISAVNYPVRLYTVGRLDKNSCGLILLTNDGELANLISKAGENHEKEYYVRVDKPVTKEFIEGMKRGVPILDKVTAPCEIFPKGENCFTIVLIQGLNRQIRRMCEYFGLKVRFLKRVRVMNISLGDLKPGEYRELSAEEIQKLYTIGGGKNGNFK
jgi:23S rRNA pseudouridine2604 synthase